MAGSQKTEVANVLRLNTYLENKDQFLFQNKKN